MRIHIQMGLRFLTEYLHFILIETFVGTELQLGRTVLEVNVADCVTNVLAPIACLRTFERCSSRLGETRFCAVDQSLR